MKKMHNTLFLGIYRLLIGLFILLHILSYLSMNYFLENVLSKSGVEVESYMSDFYQIWILLSFLLLMSLALLYKKLKKIESQINEDISSISLYVEEVSEHKNYDAVIKIKHYLVFLKISLLLKNITKRLKAKEKKNPKK